MTDTPMTPDRDPSRRDELLFMLLHGGARSEFVAQRVVDFAASEVRDEYAPEVARLGAALQGVMDEIARFGIYGPARTAAAALVRRADELVTENATLRDRVTELETAGSRLAAVERLAEEADDKNNSTIDTDLLLDALGLNADAPSGGGPTGLPAGLTGRARHDARVAMETARKTRRRAGACFTCGDVPDEWCPDCACCKAGCDGGRTNNPCTHPNAPWNTEPTP
ncbi:hypothetical protein [Streptomyces microflavus]|uniref:hypothetical protein n=1 Tax=Streptomyces microflavus TaxID=1919 RepID=UPI0033ACCD57